MSELVGKARPAATVSARVFDSDGNLLEDLGVISTPDGLSKADKKSLVAKLKRLKERTVEHGS